MRLLPIVAQNAKQLLGQHDIAILAPLGLPNSNDHPRAVNVARGQLHRLGDTQTSGIDCDEGRSHLKIGYRLQKAYDFVPRQHGWQCVLVAGIGNLLGYLLLSEGHAVEESQRAHDRVDRGGFETAPIWRILAGCPRSRSTRRAPSPSESPVSRTS